MRRALPFWGCPVTNLSFDERIPILTEVTIFLKNVLVTVEQGTKTPGEIIPGVSFGQGIRISTVNLYS